MKAFINIDSRPDFLYPKSYIDTINTEPKIDLEPWWFIAYDEGDVNSWYKILKRLYPTRELIPFAKFNASDDIACFDGKDSTGNPEVLIIHAFASEGWEHHGTVADFDEWLKTAIETKKEWDEEE
ncbi:hypothetical protein [Pseudomonas fluorescens]|uniref:hypothetical protein n=1 Tax=Pseudomonas fluorescens TaxID=294 RepID=UPI003D07B87F